jgi:hypothetical protein
MFLDYFALVVLIFVAVVLFYGIIAIHDIPYEIAKRRNHPQQDAIHVAGWISLFTLHAIWPFLLGQVDAHARPGPDQQGPPAGSYRPEQSHRSAAPLQALRRGDRDRSPEPTPLGKSCHRALPA